MEIETIVYSNENIEILSNIKTNKATNSVPLTHFLTVLLTSCDRFINTHLYFLGTML